MNRRGRLLVLRARGARRSAVAVALALAALAACGGGGETVEVGVIPIADVAPLYLGMERGFFEEEGLTVEPQLAQGGAGIATDVVSGELQFGFSNTISLLIAASQDVPVRIVAQGVLGGRTPEEAWANLLVLEDGDVDAPEDLEGRMIAVNTLNNICEVTIKASLEERGVDVTTLEFTEVPLPEMNAALEAGRADGACAVEPFVTQGTQGAARAIDPFYVNTEPDLTVATYFTSAGFAERRPETVERFTRAMNRSLEYASEHPDEVRGVLAGYTDIPPELARDIRLPIWRADLNRPTIERLAELSLRYGLIDEPPDLDVLIRE